jgi:hypothetical protein
VAIPPVREPLRAFQLRHLTFSRISPTRIRAADKFNTAEQAMTGAGAGAGLWWLQRLLFGTESNYKAAGGAAWDSWNDVTQHWVPIRIQRELRSHAVPGPQTPGITFNISCSASLTIVCYGNVTVDGLTSQRNISAPLKVSTTCSLTDPIAQ